MFVLLVPSSRHLPAAKLPAKAYLKSCISCLFPSQELHRVKSKLLGYHWRVAWQMELDLPCPRHRGQSGTSPECKLPAHTDIFIACAPCQPYSLQRAGSGPKKPCDHQAFDSLWGKTGSVLSTLARARPKVFVSENVIGFQDFRRDLISAVMSIKDPETDEPHFHSAACITLDSAKWITASRPRFQ